MFGISGLVYFKVVVLVKRIFFGFSRVFKIKIVIYKTSNEDHIKVHSGPNVARGPEVWTTLKDTFLVVHYTFPSK